MLKEIQCLLRVSVNSICMCHPPLNFSSSCTEFLPLKNEDSHILRFFLWRRFSISDSITIDAAQMESFDNPGAILGTLSNAQEQLLVNVTQAM